LLADEYTLAGELLCVSANLIGELDDQILDGNPNGVVLRGLTGLRLGHFLVSS
jgi:hypothetical protein